MRKKNIVSAGVVILLLFGLMGTALFHQETAAVSRAENSKEAVVKEDAFHQEKAKWKHAEKDTGKEEKKSDAEEEKKADGKAQETKTQNSTPGQADIEKSSAADDRNTASQNTSPVARPNHKTTEKTSGASHTHSWNAQTTVVHHPETGHNEQVLVKEAWTEKIPIYEMDEIAVCDNCKEDCTSDPSGHLKEHMLNGTGKYGWHTEWVSTVVGYDEVYHEAQYTTKWVQDSAAWDETVTTGYICSCGASK